MNKKCIALALATFLSGLAGCGGDSDNNAASNRNDNVQMHKVGTNNQNGNIGNNVNQNLRASTRAANNVERLKEIDEARVIIRGNDAYVAVRLENDRNSAGMGTTNTGTGTTGTDTGHGTNNTGTGVGYGTDTGYGTSAGATNTGTGAGYGGTNNTDTGTIDLGRTRHGQVSSTLERRITNQVRAADRDIRNVHVSVDPTFFGQMTNYTNNMRDGRNGDGLFEDFTDTVRRFF